MKNKLEEKETTTGIEKEELKEALAKVFARYGSVFKALAEYDTYGKKKKLDEIIEEDFERYDDVFRKLAE